eukprot:comp20732_c0_seq1/m.27111 comp20732_c0_seq1/g.27111  ORF comp20732_c0_seq1/g.27111 comp20732_c0_seq1/m.27111 type:complete len:818 (-) comp20732_c0_seq1:638-3091(-)
MAWATKKGEGLAGTVPSPLAPCRQPYGGAPKHAIINIISFLFLGWLVLSLLPCSLLSHLRPAGHNASNDDPIHTVHVVFMNHLDVGYSDLIKKVLPTYLQRFFDLSMDVSQALRDKGASESFIYTTHPWLVYLYLHCNELAHMRTYNNLTWACPTNMQVTRFKEAVKRGDIVWHAGAFNLQAEVASPELYDEFLEMGRSLDRLFHLPTKRVLSQRDVPGMTRSVIPHLSKYGVRFVSVGVNGGSAPPAVPKIFRWLDQSTETSVVGFWHAGGYPNDPPGGLARDNCLEVAEIGHALCFAFKTDNTGPPTLDQVMVDFKQIRENFPTSIVKASTLEAFTSELTPILGNLPTINGEIGDTWVQGIMSDPQKMQRYRALARAHAHCVADGKCKAGEEALRHFNWHLVKLPEHTWGLPDIGNCSEIWANDDFRPYAEDGISLNRYREGWIEQRKFIDGALSHIPKKHPLEKYVKRHCDAKDMKPKVPNVDGMIRLQPDSNGRYHMACSVFDASINTNGALVHLTKSGENSQTLAHPDGPLGHLVYVTLNQSDFDEVDKYYDYQWNSGFSKAGSRGLGLESREWEPMVTHAWVSPKHQSKCRMVVRLAFSDDKLTRDYGAPEAFYLEYTHNPGDKAIELTVQWFNKSTTHLPEVINLKFHSLPRAVKPENEEKTVKMAKSRLGCGAALPGWHMDKMGSWIQPSEVILNGSQHQHAVWSGIKYLHGREFAISDQESTTSDQVGDGRCNELRIESLDSAIVTPLTPNIHPYGFLLPAPISPLQPTDINGMAFNLFNNVWNTNYILFYPFLKEERNMKFRFNIYM